MEAKLWQTVLTAAWQIMTFEKLRVVIFLALTGKTLKVSKSGGGHWRAHFFEVTAIQRQVDLLNSRESNWCQLILRYQHSYAVLLFISIASGRDLISETRKNVSSSIALSAENGVAKFSFWKIEILRPCANRFKNNLASIGSPFRSRILQLLGEKVGRREE